MRTEPRPRALVDIVDGMVAGDTASILAFHEIAAPEVRSIVLRSLRAAGIWVDKDRLHDIVQDGLLALQRHIGSWRPDGGATPWGWARHRLVAIAFDHVGILAVDLDGVPEPRSEQGSTSDDVDRCPLELLAELATTHPKVAELERALSATVSERDGRVWLDLLCEESGGNRSASVTVAQTHGLSHANVRKIRQRVRQRLTALSTDDGYRSLADLAALSA